MRNTVLMDKKTLRQRHPALENRWTLEWLIRTRQIPIVKIGKKIYFDEREIEDWIDKKKIKEMA